jgi:hypothetical protein
MSVDVITICTVTTRCCYWWCGLLSSVIHHRRVFSGCIGGTWICFFAVILPDGVLLDEAMLDQVRLHHIIFLEKLVLAAISRTNGVLPTQTQTMLFSQRQQTFSHDPGKTDFRRPSVSCTSTLPYPLWLQRPCTHTQWE